MFEDTNKNTNVYGKSFIAQTHTAAQKPYISQVNTPSNLKFRKSTLKMFKDQINTNNANTLQGKTHVRNKSNALPLIVNQLPELITPKSRYTHEISPVSQLEESTKDSEVLDDFAKS